MLPTGTSSNTVHQIGCTPTLHGSACPVSGDHFYIPLVIPVQGLYALREYDIETDFVTHMLTKHHHHHQMCNPHVVKNIY
jgi:hypothetical protein